MLYKETEFQDSPMGKTPRDWEVMSMGDDDVCEDIFYGLTAKATEQNTNLKMLRTTDIKDYSADWDKLPFCEVTESRSALDKYILKKGDIVIARAGTVGVSVLVDRDFSNVIFGSYLIKVRLKSSIIPEFAHYFLQSSLYWKHIAKAQGSTLKNINLPILKSLLLPIPPVEEQRAIVGVLGVVDSAVELVDRVIAKTERLKKGLMQTLLTRGIGHKEYKQTPIGTIPKEWELATTSDVTLFIKDGTHTPPKRVEKGIPLFSAQNIVDGKIVRTDEDTYITEDDYWKIHTKYELQKNDVLLTIVGTIGNSAVVDVDYRFTLQRSVAIFRPDTEKLEPHFLHHVFQSKPFKRQLLGHSKLTTQGGVYLKELSSLMIPVPPIQEQHKITDILSTIDEKIELEKKEKVNLEKVKRGLMDLLLTGKVRVKVD